MALKTVDIIVTLFLICFYLSVEAHIDPDPFQITDNTTEDVYVDSTGIDKAGCGFWNNPCGTLYYATRYHFNHGTVSNIYIYGQNETKIELYLNESITYHPCLIFPTSQIKSINNHINIIFDHYHIKSMDDWYPHICHKYFHISYPNHLSKYLFEFNINQYIFTITNLHIQNIKINSNTSLLGIYHSSFTTKTYCNNCIFSHISVTYDTQKNNSMFYGFISLNNTIINDVNYTLDQNTSCFSTNDCEQVASVCMSSFIHLTSNEDSVHYTNLTLSHIYMHHNFFSMDKTELSLTNLTINNMQCKNAFIEDISSEDSAQSKIPKPTINYCNITNFYGTSIFKSSLQWNIDFTIQNCEIKYIAQNQHNYITDSLFNFGAGYYIIDNVAVTYEYNILKNCNVSEKYNGKNYINNFILVQCSNPISFVRSYDDAELNNIVLFFDTNYQLFENILHTNSMINYRFSQQNSFEFTDALIINFDDMHIKTLIVSPTTFHDIFLLDLGEDFTMNEFIVRHKDIVPIYNLLTSNNLYIYDSQARSASDSGSEKAFTNSLFYGVKDTLIYIDTTLGENIVNIENVLFSDALSGIYFGVGKTAENYETDSSMTILDTKFTNIGRHYLGLYEY
eukprot:490535_1